jgi:hypothetical protein
MSRALGYPVNLTAPKTFNEKLGWRILNDRNPAFPPTIDKVAVRERVAQIAGDGILIPLFGVWERIEDVPWEALPTAFAFKAAHGWNMQLLIRDKSKTSREETLAKAAKWLRYNHYRQAGEWGYKDVPPRLLAEELVAAPGGGPPVELKFQVFDGRVAALRVHHDRFTDHRVNFYDRNMQPLPVYQNSHPYRGWKLPDNIAEYVTIAEQLGQGWDYVRVDLYQTDRGIRFSELTLYESNANRPFVPAAYDRTLGDMWRLPYDRVVVG